MLSTLHPKEDLMTPLIQKLQNWARKQERNYLVERKAKLSHYEHFRNQSII